MMEDRSVIDIPNYYEAGTNEWKAIETIRERAPKELLRFKNKLTKEHLKEIIPAAMAKVEMLEKKCEVQEEMLADFFQGKTPEQVLSKWNTPFMNAIKETK
jgi:hypothetical protein